MSSWKILFDHSREYQLPLSPEEADWVSRGKKLGKRAEGYVDYRHDLIRYEFNYLDKIETLQIQSGATTETPTIQGGGWTFRLEPGGVIWPTEAMESVRAYQHITGIIRSCYPGAFPGLSARTVLMDCPVARSALGLVPANERARNTVDMRRKVLAHYRIQPHEKLFDKLYDDALVRIMAGDEVLDRIIDKDALAEFNGDTAAYLERAIRRTHFPTWLLPQDIQVAPGYRRLEEQFPEIPRRDLLCRTQHNPEQTAFQSTIDLLVQTQGPTREATLGNLADIALLSIEEKVAVLEEGLSAFMPFLDRTRSTTHAGIADSVELTGPVSNRWLEEKRSLLSTLPSSSMREISVEAYVIAEHILRTVSEPAPSDISQFVSLDDFDISSGLDELAARRMTFQNADGTIFLTDNGLEKLRYARWQILGAEANDRRPDPESRRALEEGRIFRPQLTLPRPGPMSGFPPEIGWLHIKSNHIDHRARKHLGGVAKIGKNGLPTTDPEFYIKSIMTLFGARACIYEATERRPVERFIPVIDGRYVLSPKLMNNMQVEFKPELAIDLGSEEGVDRLRDIYGATIAEFRRREDLEEPYLGLADIERARFSRRLKPAGFALIPELDLLLPEAPPQGVYTSPTEKKPALDINRLYAETSQVMHYGDCDECCNRGVGNSGTPASSHSRDTDRAVEAIEAGAVFQAIANGDFDLLQEVVEIVRSGPPPNTKNYAQNRADALAARISSLHEQHLHELDVSALRERFTVEEQSPDLPGSA